jgi:hypothetical protein
MVSIGHLPGRSVPLAMSGEYFTDKICPIFETFQRDTGCDVSYVLENADYFKVRPRHDSMWISIKKCDVPLICKWTPAYFHAYDLTWEYLKDDLIVVLDLSRDREYILNLGTAAGLFYSQFGFPKKGDAIETTMFEDFMTRNDFIPIDTCNSKEEFLPIFDIKNKKLRTTFGSSVDNVMKTKFLYDQQNKNIMKHSTEKWIKYGVCKQYGGFHRLVKPLENFSHIVQSDGSGWDRACFLGDVYDLRNRGLMLPSEFNFMRDDISYHSTFPTVILPNGEVIMRCTGNDSGKNNTASDNSIKHQLIAFQFLSEAFYEHHGYWPSLEQILENAYIPIYSDDKLGGINLEFFGLTEETYKIKETKVYGEHGIPIKPSSFLLTKVENARVDPRHEFLGSTCYYDPELHSYLPYPRVGKICSTILRVGLNEKLTPVEFFMKNFQLYLLSVTCPPLKDVLKQYLQYLLERNWEFREEIERTLEDYNFDSLTDTDAMSFHLGWEGREAAAETSGLQLSSPLSKNFL